MGNCNSDIIDEAGEIDNGKDLIRDIKEQFNSPMPYEDHLKAFPEMN